MYVSCGGMWKSEAISGQSVSRLAGFELGDSEDIERRYICGCMSGEEELIMFKKPCNGRVLYVKVSRRVKFIREVGAEWIVAFREDDVRDLRY